MVLSTDGVKPFIRQKKAARVDHAKGAESF